MFLLGVLGECDGEDGFSMRLPKWVSRQSSEVSPDEASGTTIPYGGWKGGRVDILVDPFC